MNITTHHYPQKMGKIILHGFEEVIGKSGVESVLHLAGLENSNWSRPSVRDERAFSFEEISQLHQSLEQAYGPRGGRGLALRAGRACFKYGIKEYAVSYTHLAAIKLLSSRSYALQRR